MSRAKKPRVHVVTEAPVAPPVHLFTFGPLVSGGVRGGVLCGVIADRETPYYESADCIACREVAEDDDRVVRHLAAEGGGMACGGEPRTPWAVYAREVQHVTCEACAATRRGTITATQGVDE